MLCLLPRTAARLHHAWRQHRPAGGSQSEHQVAVLRIGRVPGLWVRAVLLDDRRAYRSLPSRMNNGQKGCNDDEPAVLQAACELVMRRFFGPDHSGSDITRFIAEVRTRVARTKPPLIRERWRLSSGQHWETQTLTSPASGARNSSTSGQSYRLSHPTSSASM